MPHNEVPGDDKVFLGDDSFDVGCEVNGLAASPCGQFVYLACQDNTVRIWDLKRRIQTHVLRGHKYWVNDIAASSDGLRICSASTDKTVKVWNVKAAEPAVEHTLRHLLSVAGVSFSDDATRLASASWDKRVYVWDVENGTELLQLHGHADWVHSVSWSYDGQRLASASSDLSVRVWSMITGEVEQVLVGHLQTVMKVCFCRDGKRLASGSLDRSIRIWNYVECTIEARIFMAGESESIYSISFVDCDTLVVGCKNKFLFLYDIRTNQRLAKYTGHDDIVTGVIFTGSIADGNAALVSCSHDRSMRVWPLAEIPKVEESPLSVLEKVQYSVSFRDLQEKLRRKDDRNYFSRRELPESPREFIDDKDAQLRQIDGVLSNQDPNHLDFRHMINSLASVEQQKPERNFSDMQKEIGLMRPQNGDNGRPTGPPHAGGFPSPRGGVQPFGNQIRPIGIGGRYQPSVLPNTVPPHTGQLWRCASQNPLRGASRGDLHSISSYSLLSKTSPPPPPARSSHAVNSLPMNKPQPMLNGRIGSFARTNAGAGTGGFASPPWATKRNMHSSMSPRSRVMHPPAAHGHMMQSQQMQQQVMQQQQQQQHQQQQQQAMQMNQWHRPEWY